MNATIGDAIIYGSNTLSEGIKGLSDLVTKTAPEIWRIYILQQYAYAAGLLVAAMGAGYLSYLSYKLGRKIDDGDCEYFLYGLTGVFIIFVIVLGIFATIHAINPEYYAIQQLLRVFK